MTGPGQRADRVLIVDDHLLLGESLVIALENASYAVERLALPSPGSGSLASVLSTILRRPPRLVLLDLDLGPLGDGTRLIQPLSHAGARVIVLTATTSKARWGECLRLGASHVLQKTTPLADVISTARRALDGRQLMSCEDRQELIEFSVAQRESTLAIRKRLARLTPREAEILKSLVDGKQVKDIARDSVVSEATVRTQVKSILIKLETNSQIAAVGAAHRVGWPHVQG